MYDIIKPKSSMVLWDGYSIVSFNPIRLMVIVNDRNMSQ
jgi:hypothetical protein